MNLPDLFNHDEALGLPPGTIRGLVIVILTVSVCGLCFLGRQVPEVLAMAFSSSIGFYFGVRSGNGGKPPQNQVQPAT